MVAPRSIEVTRTRPVLGRDFIHTLLVLGIFMATGDIFFVVSLGGLTVRLTQLCILLASFAYLSLYARDRLVLPKDIFYLLTFVGITAVFAVMPFMQRNIPFSLAMCFYVVAIFLFTNYYGTSTERLLSLVRCYLYSYLFLATFGIMQFLLGFVGVSLLVSQWWIEGLVARANGFSYEPSYYALYMNCGLGVVITLLDLEAYVLPKRMLIFLVGAIAVAIFCSTSRSGMAFAYMFFLFYCVGWVFKWIRNAKVDRTRLRVLIVGASLPVAAVIYFAATQPALASYFLMGLGVVDSSTHSVAPRVEATTDTLMLAARHPFVGVGLGGVGPALADAATPGITYDQYLAIRTEGTNIYIETFASGGVVGGIAILLYLMKLVVCPFQLRREDGVLGNVAIALTVGLVCELILLFMESNIVRAHLWTHIAVLSAVTTGLYRLRLGQTVMAHLGRQNLAQKEN